VKTPGPEAKGSIIGFGGVHTRAHVYRAIIEGLCYALRDGAEATQRRTWHRIRELRVSGGGSQSDHALQITADIFDLPVLRPRLYEASSLGAAIDGAVGCGLHADFGAAVAAMTGSQRTFEPRPEQVRIYGELYHQVYKSMYRRMQPLFRRLKRITGYPD
jgi:sugar (pentulose or hexulose) kinase